MNQKDIIENTLLIESQLKHGFPLFSKIEEEHFLPAFVRAIELAKAEIDAIVVSSEEPTFENTILALESAGELLSNISSIFFNLNSCRTSERMQQIAMEVSPLLADYGNDVSLNEELFERIVVVRDKADINPLPQIDMRLLECHYKSFARSGAALKGDDKDKYRALTKELSNLSLQFQQNLLAATNGFTLHITEQSQLAGLPDYVVEMGRESAQEAGREGWVFSLHMPSYMPFMQYSEDRALREELWKAYGARCYGGEFDNSDIIRKIVNLRCEKAQLLGYANHAEYILEERMANSPVKVLDFLDTLRDKTFEFSKRELAEIAAYASEKFGFNEELQGWDFAFYSEKYKEEMFNISEQMLKPYFELDKVEQGVFMLCEKLYGLSFVEDSSLEAYHPDVKVFEVFDGSGKFISMLMLDYFPRASKSSGAWMTSYREQYYKDGANITPIVSVVCNFTKPTSTTPSLLTFNEFNTLLHEMGHALHGMLSDVKYSSLSGTNVSWDFVELPSQLMENWAVEPEFLNMWAKHYQSGETIPSDIIAKIVESKNFLACYSSTRQLSFGLCDMAWHTITEPMSGDIKEFESLATSKVQMLPSNDSVATSTAFSHIFSGGYSAGYYSYKWAELLDADAFEKFKQEGIFSKDVASSFKEHVLSKGGSQEAMELYVAFRGAEPSVEPLIRRMGIEVK